MAGKFKSKPDLEWTLLAASKDDQRPTLTYVQVTEAVYAATDGHRLHVVARSPGDGYVVGAWTPRFPGRRWDLWMPNSKQANFEAVFAETKMDGNYNLLSPDCIGVLKAAEAHGKVRGYSASLVSLPTTVPLKVVEDGDERALAHVRINATYLIDMLTGRSDRKDGPDGVIYAARSPYGPLMVNVWGLNRIAVIMPVRVADRWTPEPRFDLSEFVTEFQRTAGEVPEVVLPAAEIETPGGQLGKKEGADDAATASPSPGEPT